MKNKIYIPFIMAICVCVIGMIGLGIVSYRSESKLEAVVLELWQREEDMRQCEDRLIDTQNKLIESQENLYIEEERCEKLNEKINSIITELEEANKTIQELKSDEYELVYVGDFKITYYCDGRYPHICGGNGVTASGKPTEVGVTAAADWSMLPNGSIIYIEGVGFREVQDVGGGVNGKHIDVLVQKHQEALDLGINYEGVWLLIKK